MLLGTFADKRWVSTTSPLPPAWLPAWGVVLGAPPPQAVHVLASLLEGIEPRKHLGLGRGDENML